MVNTKNVRDFFLNLILSSDIIFPTHWKKFSCTINKSDWLIL